MQIEIDILKETLDVLKKDLGADITFLKNLEKAVIISAMKNKYSLPLLLQKLNISRNSYYYQCNRIECTDKYATLHTCIIELIKKSYERYGYRRIHTLLPKEGIRE